MQSNLQTSIISTACTNYLQQRRRNIPLGVEQEISCLKQTTECTYTGVMVTPAASEAEDEATRCYEEEGEKEEVVPHVGRDAVQRLKYIFHIHKQTSSLCYR